MKSFPFTAAAWCAALALAAQPALAGGPFNGVTSTVDGFHTWDSDLINLEAVAQTGHGVYVAVLDTGLVPNWRDYFPKRASPPHWAPASISR